MWNNFFNLFHNFYKYNNLFQLLTFYLFKLVMNLNIENILFVNGFPSGIRSRDVFELFTEKFRNVRSVNMFESKNKGTYALIQFGSHKQIKDAINMSSMSIMYNRQSYKIVMNEYFTKNKRQQKTLPVSQRESQQESQKESRSRYSVSQRRSSVSQRSISPSLPCSESQRRSRSRSPMSQTRSPVSQKESRSNSPISQRPRSISEYDIE